MTHKELLNRVRALNLTCRCYDGEYRINLRKEDGGTEDTACYTNDRDDAFFTARHLAQARWSSAESQYRVR